MAISPSSGRKAVFLDKDGTLIDDVPYNVDPALITFTEHAFDGLNLLQAMGFELIIVTNQPGVAHGYFDENAVTAVQLHLQASFERQGLQLAGFYYCPHHPTGSVSRYTFDCNCRKPMDGLLRWAAIEHRIDLSASWMIGDILNDVEAGSRAGCRTVLIDNGNETEWQHSALRTPDLIAGDLAEAAAMILNAIELKSVQGRMVPALSA